MTTDQDDDALRRAFADLRREDAARRPSFASLMNRADRPARTRARLAIVCVSTAAIALATMLVVRLAMEHRPSPPPMASIEPWTAPTDFLLRTPGIEVLESVPRIAPRRALLSLDGLATQPDSNRRSPSP